MTKRNTRPGGDSHVPTLPEFERFLGRLASTSHLHLAFNHLTDTRVVVKDCQGRFLWVSENVPARHGYDARSMLGLRDSDINPRELAALYEKDDAFVLRTGTPILGKTEIAFDESGLPGWFRVNKLPLRDRHERIIGLIATIQAIPEGRSLPAASGELRIVISHIRAHLDQPLRINDLAALIRLTSRQLERRFQQATGLTPTQFITRCRVAEACRQLLQTHRPIGQIALSVGFYDQSAFTKVFRKQLGLTPLQFRKAKSQPKRR